MRTAYDAARFQITDCRTETAHEDMKREVLEGLTAQQKHLPCKYFYDSRGSALFEQICRLPEYYQTRTELSILRKAARPVMRQMKSGNLIELGSGTNWKVRLLLDAANGSRGRLRYIPVDVCESALIGAAEELLCLYPDLAVSGIVADFHKKIDWLQTDETKLITFFGGTLGNFDREAGEEFLRNIAGTLRRDDRLLLGVDMVKEKEILEAAYNDSQNITARFNRNILSVLNRELNGDFDPADFDHLAFYNESREQIEMHLRATRQVRVRIEDLDMDLSLGEGETIFTEISRKFRRKTLEGMADAAGLSVVRWFTDRREWFALAELTLRN